MIVATEDFLKKLCPTSKKEIVTGIVKFLNQYLAKYEVHTPIRFAHFIAQAAHESAHFQTLEEYASGKDYEGRKDLGNVNPGDGVRYKGRGIFQLTGRANYRTFGGILLENNPHLAQSPKFSVLIALEYWKKHGLNALADKDDLLAITRKINGGTNGRKDREKYLKLAKKLLVI